MNSFFPSTVTERNKIRKSESSNIFKKSILKFVWSSQNRVDNCHKPKQIQLLTRLRVGLSHLREHKFKNSFQDTLNPICICHAFTFFTVQTICIKERHSCTVPNIFGFNNDQITEIFLLGKEHLDNVNNTSIMDATINHLIETKRYNIELF